MYYSDATRFGCFFTSVLVLFFGLDIVSGSFVDNLLFCGLTTIVAYDRHNILMFLCYFLY